MQDWIQRKEVERFDLSIRFLVSKFIGYLRTKFNPDHLKAITRKVVRAASNL
jgi:hypothetical protein